ncbi:MAG: hypothetical protein K8R02_05840 [Anaerohalosphaeraceae bacterium]|nr:hypothetical protein [Anaerohalosphaeraceae bacterium]
MGRHSKRIAMYEVIGKANLKSAQGKVLDKDSAGGEQEAPGKPVTKCRTTGNWPSKPGPVRFYKDRVEFCFSWQVAMIGILALLAMFLVFFRLGQWQSSSALVERTTIKQDITPLKPPLPERSVKRSLQPTTSPRLVEPMGDNVIVISSYHIKSHLEPVKEYFRRYSIETEIIAAGNRYLLVTQSRFDNPEKVGTDGFDIKKRIIAIGANYKPPVGSGFESFGSRPFSDAYGMKID